MLFIVKFTRKEVSNTERVIEPPTITINGEFFVEAGKTIVKNYKFGSLLQQTHRGLFLLINN